MHSARVWCTAWLAGSQHLGLDGEKSEFKVHYTPQKDMEKKKG
jgi:hypothetical protein